MKYSKDIMHVAERYDRHGNLRFELHYSGGKDSKTGKYKQYVKTYVVPPELTGKKEIAAFRAKVQLDFKEEIEKRKAGIIIPTKKKLFSEFSNEVAESLLERNSESYSYYRKFKDALIPINSQLGDYQLNELNQEIIDNFLIWLTNRTFTKVTVTVKESLSPLIKARKLKYVQVATSIGLSDSTLKEALTTGKRISKDTAERLCKFLDVPINTYFDIKITQQQYTKSVNQSTRVVLSYVLKKAANRNYIIRNFCSKDYADNVGGRTPAKKNIYDTRESILEFDRCLDKEENPQIKIACALYLHLGLRGCEASALEWGDFTFKTPKDSEVHIQRNSIYVSGFGVKTKDVKTTKSERTIIMTERLYYLLMEYRKWWSEQEYMITDRLFQTCSGENRSGQILREYVTAFEKKYDLSYVSPHFLRKTNISLQGLVHAPQKAVQARAGHAHFSTTADIYDLGTKDANQEAANLLNDFFATNEDFG